MVDTARAPASPPTGAAPLSVTVFGTGVLGTALTGALLTAGRHTTVWNRTRARAEPLAARGARVADDVASAVDASPVLIVAVATYDDVALVLAPERADLAGRTVVNLTSGTPEQARAIASQLEAAGAAYLDAAAMSGTERIGRPEALFLYSGDRAAFVAAQPILQVLGRAEYVGADPGRTSYVDTAC